MAFDLLRRANEELPAQARAGSLDPLTLAVVAKPGYGEHWPSLQRELASRSSNARFFLSDLPGHSIQMTRPALVVEATLHVLEGLRRAEPGRR